MWALQLLMIAPLSSFADGGGMHAVSNSNVDSRDTPFQKISSLLQHNFKKLFETSIWVQPVLSKMIA